MHRNRLALISLAFAAFLCFSLTPSLAAPRSTLQVSFINVGQGDSILLHDDSNFDVLIDGGQPSAGPTVAAYLRQQHINDVDVMVSTHADADHVGGLTNVLEMTDVPVQAVYYNGYAGGTSTWNGFVNAVSQEGLALMPLQFPGTVTWGSMTVNVLNPTSGLSSPAQNDASVVLLVTHGNNRFLFTGDISSAVETIVMGHGIPLAAPVLKVAHHGSAYSSSAAFLSAVRPIEAVISVGVNSYGHLAPETLARLQAAGARIWRTD